MIVQFPAYALAVYKNICVETQVLYKMLKPL